MNASGLQPLTITVSGDSTVSALLLRPAQARAAYVFAHGAGAGTSRCSVMRVYGAPFG